MIKALKMSLKAQKIIRQDNNLLSKIWTTYFSKSNHISIFELENIKYLYMLQKSVDTPIN